MTVPPAAVEAAERDVQAGRAPSVSAWVGEAMEAKARQEKLADLLQEIRSEIGPATDEETRWAHSILGL